LTGSLSFGQRQLVEIAKAFASALLPVRFARPLDDQQTVFAFGEAPAHVNYMARRGQLAWTHGDNDRMSVLTV
jgi:hypothetical protein